jgi:hypothetical protein
LLSSAGSSTKRQAPIDPSNYGVKNFPALFEATGLFEIVKAENRLTYVADKRNKDWTKAHLLNRAAWRRRATHRHAASRLRRQPFLRARLALCREG